MTPETAAARPVVLLVVADPEVRTLTRLALERRYDVVVAADEPDATRALEACASDVGAVLVDVTVPAADGERTLTSRTIAERVGRRIPVIGTGPATREHATRAFWVGCDDYLPRPFFRRELLTAVAAVIAA